jgi:hypothetical protein
MMLTDAWEDIQTVPNRGWSPMVDTATGGPEMPLMLSVSGAERMLDRRSALWKRAVVAPESRMMSVGDSRRSLVVAQWQWRRSVSAMLSSSSEE